MYQPGDEGRSCFQVDAGLRFSACACVKRDVNNTDGLWASGRVDVCIEYNLSKAEIHRVLLLCELICF